MADKPCNSSPTEPQSSIDSSHISQNISFNTSRPQTLSSASISQKTDPTYTSIPSQTTPMARDNIKMACDISSLVSPPEPVPYDSFHQGQRNASSASGPHMGHEATKPSMPMSPPVSPNLAGSVNPPAPDAPSSMAKDPILYPRDDAALSPTQPPLFPNTETIDNRRIVDEHIVSRPPGLFREGSPPQREHYELALELKSKVVEMFSNNRKSWFEKERDQVMADRRLNSARWNSGVRYQNIAPAQPAPAKTTKPVSARAKTASARTKTTPVSNKTNRIAKPSQAPRPVRTHPPTRHVRRVSATPDPARRVVAPNREDRDFGALPDYCPPVSALVDKPNWFKVDWKGAPIDLSGDPNIKLLHPDEAILAATLRLDCATYLTSKRRMFIRRLECVGLGKEFRRTDAQQACKIDVNKATRLWIAFGQAGWLDLKWMSEFN